MLLDRDDNAGTTFGGHRSLKIWEGKKHLKSVRFMTTFDFDHKSL